MNNQTELNEKKVIESSDPDATTDEQPADEFKLTIKKLELPVRPRGVLAE
jgi:hypothetical protein